MLCYQYTYEIPYAIFTILIAIHTQLRWRATLGRGAAGWPVITADPITETTNRRKSQK